MTTLINASTSSGIVVTSDNSGEFALQSNGVTKATLTNAGFAYPGAVIQVVQASYQGATSTTSASFQNTGLSGTITPKSSSSKIYVSATLAAKVQSGTTNCITLFRNGSNLLPQHLLQHSSAGDYVPVTLQYLDSPNTASACTYTVYFRSAAGNGSYTSAVGGDQYGAYPVQIITMMEIAQ
jgi:hypothetical protein